MILFHNSKFDFFGQSSQSSVKRLNTSNEDLAAAAAADYLDTTADAIIAAAESAASGATEHLRTSKSSAENSKSTILLKIKNRNSKHRIKPKKKLKRKK